MSLRNRILLGAVFGAFFVLLAHPLSRSAFAPYLLRWGDSPFLENTPALIENLKQTPQPRSLQDAAYWMLLAAVKDQRLEKVTPDDAKKLVALSQWAAARDPDNAFWPQMESVWQLRLGDKEASVRAWSLAGNLAGWNDYQNDRLRQVREGLKKEDVYPKAWHAAYAYFQRNPAVGATIQRHARAMKALGASSEDLSLHLRYRNLLNGRLLRDEARSNELGLIGVDMIEQATHKIDLPFSQQPRKLIVSRNEFIGSLRNRGLVTEAARSEETFSQNEAWFVFVNHDASTRKANQQALIALIVSAFPGVAIMIALVGLWIGITGFFLERYAALQMLLQPKTAPILGVLLAIGVFWTTKLALPALLVALSLGFFAFTPPSIRSQEPKDLGYLFRFMMIVLGGAFALSLAMFLVGFGAPGIRLLGLIGVPQELGAGSGASLGYAAIVMLLVLMMAPIWGLVQRYLPARIAGFAFKQIGLGAFFVFFTVGVLSAPVCLLLDRSVGFTLQKLSENEPVNYLPR